MFPKSPVPEESGLQHKGVCPKATSLPLTFMTLISRFSRWFGTPRRRVVAVGALALVILVACCGQGWVAHEIERRLSARLAENGFVLEHRGKLWSPWRGLRLSEVKVLRAEDGSPVVEAGNLEMDFPLAQLLGGPDKVSHWRIRHAAVALHDAAGEVRLEKVSIQLEARKGEILVQSAQAAKDGLTVDLKGKILTGSVTPKAQPNIFDWQAVRGTIAALQVRQSTGPFHVTGNFDVDATQADTAWSAQLEGKGEDLEWQGVPLRGALAKAALSSGKSEVTIDLRLPHGTSEFKMTRDGWQKSAFVFTGSLVDGKGARDEFKGSYRVKTLKIERLEGPANLWEMAKGLPAIAPHLPPNLTIETFPNLLVTDILRDGQQSPAVWSVNSIRSKGNGALTVKTGDQEIEVTGLSGAAGYDGQRWNLNGVRGKAFGGSVAVDGSLDRGKLTKSHVVIGGMRWAELRQWAGHDDREASKGILSIDYRGDLDLRKKQAEGQGQVRLENAPVFEVPLLDQTYDLFAALVPGVKRAGSGQFDATFKAHPKLVEVTRFEAKGGSVTVSAIGTIDLEKQRVDGRARGKLSGLPGLVTGPLGRLLEMDVGGPYDDIRVKPLGPAKLVSNAASTAIGAPIETLEESTKIAGTVLIEGIKLPFRLFSKEKREEQRSKP